MGRSLEKVKCYVNEHEIYGDQLRQDIERFRLVERYFRDMQKIGFDKLLILSLFSAHIYDREYFENQEKLLRLKDNLEQADHLVNPLFNLDHNLFTLAIIDKDKKSNEAVTDHEFCSGKL
jgi:hypothetical protein